MVGWFDQLDPQWNVTQCAQDKVKLVLKLKGPVMSCFILLLAHLPPSGYPCTAKAHYHLDHLTGL